MATIHVDGKAYEVADGSNLLHVCLSLGLNLPYFCWHPAMGSVGACRQCAVKQFRDESDTRGRLVMACMTPAANGARIAIEDPDAVTFRGAVIEGLMVNHPHDCPVCDEGGECHLQDMTLMTGHAYRRYSFPKRTFRNQYLGPLVNHEMNRCIQCYRCVRFYREYAGGGDFNSFALRDIVFFGRERDGVLENEFSGNLVEVCPTGVFTDATLKQHYTRKWDLQWAPSVCVHCSLGCNTSPGERYGMLRRIVNRFNHEINGYFLCDRGRYGYDFVNSDRRVRTPLVRRDSSLERVSAKDATSRVAGLLSSGGDVIGIGSPRASIEANFALRTLVGPDRFFAGVGDSLQAMVDRIAGFAGMEGVVTPTLHDVERCDAVLVLGEDVTNTAPRMALALRQSVRQVPLRNASRLKIPLWLDHAVREAIQERRGPLFVASPAATRLDEVATTTYRAAPDDIARLGFAIAREIHESAAPVGDLAESEAALSRQVAIALLAAERPLVVSGAGCLSMPVILAAAAVARALAAAGRPAAALGYAVPDCNSVGLALMRPRPFGEAVEEVGGGRAATVVVLENDLYHRAPAASVDALLGQARHVIAIDCLHSRTTDRAELVLSAGTFGESDGTLVNNEGRAQRFFRVLNPDGEVMESWRWLRDVMTVAEREEGAAWATLDDVILAIGREMPTLAAIREAAPPASFRLAGDRVPRQPGRYSGRTAMNAAVSLHEPAPPADVDSPLSFSMEGYRRQPPPALTPFFWSPGWNSIQALNKFQEEVAGPLRGDPPGVRIFGRPEPGAATDASAAPPAFRPRAGEWLVIPLHHIFGSDELSALAPAIAELAPRPYLALNDADVIGLGLSAGAWAEVLVEGERHRFPVAIDSSLAAGVAGIPAGLPGTPALDRPVWARIARAEGQP